MTETKNIYFDGKSSFDGNFFGCESETRQTNPQVYFFAGSASSLRKEVSQLKKEDFSKLKSLRIKIKGTEIKKMDKCCLYMTIVVGSVFVVPLLFFCCDWWKRKVNALYNVENIGYDAITDLIRSCDADELYLMIEDNFFNRSKAEVIIETLQTSNVRNFVFVNSAGGFDADGQNYTKFESYMRPIKSSHMKCDVSWASKVLL